MLFIIHNLEFGSVERDFAALKLRCWIFKQGLGTAVLSVTIRDNSFVFDPGMSDFLKKAGRCGSLLYKDIEKKSMRCNFEIVLLKMWLLSANKRLVSWR